VNGKYELTGETKLTNGHKLYRIRAFKDVGVYERVSGDVKVSG
jgi:hypothetical protein